MKNKKQKLFSILIIVICLGIYPLASAEPNATSVNVQVKTIAVMNFDNRSPDGQWQWLCKGLADMIITDLSGSNRLIIVERERLNEIVAEHQLIKTGLVDASIAEQVGQIAKVKWVLFGSFIKKDESLRIEAHILDLETQDLLRVEWIEGAAGEVVQLEKRLIQKLLERLNTPITPTERASIMYVPTDSIPALEHYSRSLDYYDNGQWHESLFECRLAVRNDRQYIKARGQVAKMYYELGEPEHALVEYRDLVKTDGNNLFPEHIYFRMGQLLDDQYKDHQAAIILYEKILQRHPELRRVFDEVGKPLDNPPTVEIAGDSPRYPLEALDRIAAYQERQNDKVEAAKIYWQIYTIMLKGKLQQGVLRDIMERAREKYDSLYQQLIQENRNSLFAPFYSYFYNKNLVIMFPVPSEGGIFSEKDFGQYYQHLSGEFQNEVKFLAPKDKEFSEISVTVNTDTAVSYDSDYVQIDCYPHIRKHMDCVQHRLKTGVRTANFKLDPGNRLAEIIIFGKNSNSVIEIKLRDFSVQTEKPDLGKILFRYHPFPPQNIFIDESQIKPPFQLTFSQMVGYETVMSPGNHVVRFEWLDGTTKSMQFEIQKGQNKTLYIDKDSDSWATCPIAERGTWTNLYLDKKGKIWLLWDQTNIHDIYSSPDEKSDIFCSTSEDGIHWKPQQKMSISSSEMDMKPVLQQDSKGVYWVLYCSSRDPDVPQSFWISSSVDGVEWSFPRKINIPFQGFKDINNRDQVIQNNFCFTMDREDNFWISWFGRYYKSSNSIDWQEMNLFENVSDRELFEAHPEFMGYDHANHLFLMQYKFKRIAQNDGTDEKRGIITRSLWTQQNKDEWTHLGDIVDDHVLNASGDSSSKGIVVVYASHQGIFLRCHSNIYGWSDAIQIESYYSLNPAYPSVAMISEKKVVVAYSSKEGVFAETLNIEDIYESKSK